MKVLALHGKQQNAEVFRGRCSKLTARALREKVVTQFYFHDAPHTLPLKDGDQVPMRTWYLRQKDGKVDVNSLEQTLSELEEVWRTHGPFDGILGFSMGGAMASILASLPNRFPNLAFVLIAGAPDIEIKSVIDPKVQSLHLVGLDDRTVLPKSSHALANKYRDARVAEHELGHCLPMKANHMQLYMQFLLDMQSVVGVKTLAPKPAVTVSGDATSSVHGADIPPKPTVKAKEAIPLHYCTSDEVAALQSEEVEVLSAIYPDEFQLVPPGMPYSAKLNSSDATVPAKKGDLCASFHIKLLLEPESFEPEANEKFPRQWMGQIGLHFTLPGSYPLTQAPLVTVTTGKLTLSDGFSDSKIASLEEAVRLASAGGESAEGGGCVGEACGMLCMQAANDWFSSGQWLTCGAAKTAISLHSAAHEQNDPEDDNNNTGKTGLEEQTYHEEVDEVVEAENIRLATMEAYEKAHLARLEAARPVNAQEKRDVKAERMAREAALLPASARGVWTYTVGLVGKPSAGKSTFYNAVTRAALERGGRLMAEVAPHPFTTIEPNVGPGWYASFEKESEHSIEAESVNSDGANDLSQYRRYPLHGRVPTSSTSAAPTAKVAFESYAGRRMLPVVVKDVAGLVPGAYKGRGKGNRFLADLCDADVLVHVVDVTGQADRDGNAVVSNPDLIPSQSDSTSEGVVAQDKGSTPMEDAEWIREELHRWIYGNVRGKWNSVLACTRTMKQGQKLAAGKTAPPLASQQQRDRAAQRVLALFTGYQGPRWCVELAAERAGLQLEYAATWTARDLHRMVAHFLSIRFPVCLALNKIDSLDVSDEAQAVIAHCQETARLRGEAAVPVSARAECWILNQQAALCSGTAADSLATAQSADSSKKKPTAVALATEEALCQNVLRRYGTTGVLEAISEAVKLRPPVLCYPVCDLESECPVGWTPGKAFVPASVQSYPHASQEPAASDAAGNALPRLQDCLQLKPGSTVGDVFEALKRGVLSQSAAVVHGEFVRADARSLAVPAAGGATRVVQLRKDSVLDASNCVLRVQTNRKSVWQGGGNAGSTAVVSGK